MPINPENQTEIHEGKFPKELIENLEKYDLDHEIENQELAEKRALAIIDNFGIENAFRALQSLFAL